MKNFTIRESLNTLFYAILAFLWIVPVFWLLGKAFTPEMAIYKEGYRIIPSTFTLKNITDIFAKWPFIRWFFNSLLVTTGAIILTAIVSILAGFSFSRLHWKGRDFVFLLFLSSMFIPWEINAIPLYFIMNTLGLLNTRIGVYLPMVAMPIGVFLIRQFLINIPQELEDAARMDGCNSMTLLLRILLPLSIPALGALTIWIFIFAWNEFFWSMISLKKSAMLTLPIGLKTIMGSQNIEYGILFGASLLALIPSLVIFAVLRKRIINGISISGAIK